ncbi:MAG TPA: hypothetical protein VNE38_07960 [Ktedonobacteraceae bacterium]|nr:hypothetical protein [Ktedonobacteraceae bacterium]
MINDTVGPIDEITEEAVRVLDAANVEGFSLRLLGGLAIYLQSPSAQTNEQLKRSYKDLDFVTLSKHTGKTKALFAKLGYSANKNYNALHGHQRLLFWDEQHGRQVDIFVDRMQMCHNIDFRARLNIDEHTLSLADLMLTKLQIIEVNEKDMLDVMALFIDFNVIDSEQGINSSYITSLISSDWGLNKTLETNLKKMKAFAAERGFQHYVQERIDKLLADMEKKPKSLSWKTRAMVGERVRWYELPEEPR